MKFFSMYTPDPKHGQMGPEAQAEMEKMIAETMKSGTLVMIGAIMPLTHGGARIRAVDGRITTNGPFIETKEIVGGFAIIEAKSRDEAIGMVNRFLKIAGNGECEMHQLTGPEDNGGRKN